MKQSMPSTELSSNDKVKEEVPMELLGRMFSRAQAAAVVEHPEAITCLALNRSELQRRVAHIRATGT